jgi:hypothetical protein
VRHEHLLTQPAPRNGRSLGVEAVVAAERVFREVDSGFQMKPVGVAVDDPLPALVS